MNFCDHFHDFWIFNKTISDDSNILYNSSRQRPIHLGNYEDKEHFIKATMGETWVNKRETSSEQIRYLEQLFSVVLERSPLKIG